MTDEQNNSREQVVDIDSLRQDTHNFNRGTEELTSPSMFPALMKFLTILSSRE